MKHYSRLIAFLLVFLVISHTPPASAQELFRPIQTSIDDMELIDVGTVEEIVKADLIRLDNGRRFFLDNIRVPPFISMEVKEYLTKSLVGKKVGIYLNRKVRTDREDKNGNYFGHMQTEDGIWVQEDLVSRGMAWANGTEVKRDLLLRLYKMERKAREQKIGFWADKEYSIRNASNIHAYLNSYQLFDGKVTSVSMQPDVMFTFGDPQRTTPALVARIPARLMKNFYLTSVQQMDFHSFNGVRLRIRGWVKQGEKAPEIELAYPEQLEFPDYEKYDREMLMKTVNPPPIMPYDVKLGPPVKK